MSDLAPFVAAAIESKVVKELKEENDRLREEINISRAAVLSALRGDVSVEITGEGGTNVFARGFTTRQDFFSFGPPPPRIIALSNPNDANPCKISQHRFAEVRVNGVKIATLEEFDELNTNTDGTQSESHQYTYNPRHDTYWIRFEVNVVHASTGHYIPDSEDDFVVFRSLAIRFTPDRLFG